MDDSGKDTSASRCAYAEHHVGPDLRADAVRFTGVRRRDRKACFSVGGNDVAASR